MDHGALRLLGAGAALDDLDPGERHAHEAHLPGCRSCSRLALDLEQTLTDLALLAPRMTPPGTLRTSVMTAVRSVEGQAVPVLTPTSLRARARTPVALGLAAVLAIMVVGLGAVSVRLDSELESAKSRASMQSAVMAVIADPGHHSSVLHAEAAAPAASAAVVWRPGTPDAFVMVDHLPPTPAGMAYRLWHADAAGVHPLGMFRYDGAEPFLASFGVDLGGSAAVMITLESETDPTGEPGVQVVFGELPSGTATPTR